MFITAVTFPKGISCFVRTGKKKHMKKTESDLENKRTHSDFYFLLEDF